MPSTSISASMITRARLPEQILVGAPKVNRGEVFETRKNRTAIARLTPYQSKKSSASHIMAYTWTQFKSN
jgi:hypothetical protein